MVRNVDLLAIEMSWKAAVTSKLSEVEVGRIEALTAIRGANMGLPWQAVRKKA